MRWLAIVVLCACGSSGNSEMTRPPLDGPYNCVTTQCGSGQICIVESAGSQCWVNDAGIGPYDPVSWTCVDLPAGCNGVASCDCMGCEGQCFGTSGNGRQLDCGCI